ncbi:ABC transporter ATP-binding protein [Paenactinomyces guangxiensis]|uniref:Spermidine/putrescine import ATP-binding protein PotA n=1 Tax=Paenactinomyces guangxiensis TaxID=1490290 RepID=A0A7W1WRD7_9BACL|nr:ABC transporter ATP-binding protein [Paenactinomyces guangxiensis]MBA4494563.1 ABC transporter ATP-binding protein [Paenactinomyces guangxiensis]MBH8591674.1 ABC transporter ATP-binding protein [Paenactinomyces guangxiensis]
MSRVQLLQVNKTFDGVVAVKQLDLEIQEGEFFTLLGPSGCGKTTTLRMIAGFYYPTKGKILFDDQEVTLVPPHRRNTGMVFQNYALFPHMTVFENVAFGLEVRKIPRKEIRDRVGDALRQVRLDGYGERRISQLSGGQQQRVALARALVIRPRILLLDEPLSNLDARLRDEMRAEILSIQRSLGITTIYVTHDQVEALSMSNRIAVFNQGVCQQVGTPDEVYNRPCNTFVASFVGETNLIPVTIQEVTEEYITVKYGDYTLRVRQESEKFPVREGENHWYLSIRPEGVQLASESGPNTVRVQLQLAQFTGISFQCTSRLDDQQTLQALLVNRPNLAGSLRAGETLWFHLPENQLRLIPAHTGGTA